MSAPFDLSGRALSIPSVQAEPLPVALVNPSPCTLACPAGINVKAYVSLVAEGRHGEALEVIRRRNPLPAICGRICHHPCEKACKRGRYDEAIAIRALKRFVADAERDHPKPAPPAELVSPKRVAIIGSGPAGLTTAYDLRLAGFPVTLFESEPEPGGMLRYGIADYRLPRDILDAEIGVLVRAGVDIHTGRRLGRDFDLAELRSNGFAAVALAVGAQRGRLLGLKDERSTRGMEEALSFLRRVNDGDRSPVEGRVVVIGGGSTAIETARCALRLGASSVQILYRRYREELLADEEEIAAAEAEGVKFRFLVAPKRLLRPRGQLRGVECVSVGLGAPDHSGRRRPIEIPGTETVIEAEHLFAAVGQETDLDFLTEEFAGISDAGRVAIDTTTAMTKIDGIFAAGDAVTGPSTVIEAIAAGHRAAESIRHFLEEGRADIREERPERRAAPEYEIPEPPPLEAPRVRPPLQAVEAGSAFAEVERAFTAEEAVSEARRCLRCGPCGECRICAPSCSKRHVMLRLDGESETILLRAPGSVARALSADQPAPAAVVPSKRKAEEPSAEPEPRSGAVLPVRARFETSRCRACARCVEVCPFKALRISADGTVEAHAELEPALCRGCGLCAAVCPTHSALQSALSAEWWHERLDHALGVHGGRQSTLVLACQRRAGSFETPSSANAEDVDVVRLRCVGQITAGMLVELFTEPFRKIVVAGCQSERCRFTEGAELAAEQIERAREMVASMGLDPSRIVADWSPNRAGDPLQELLRAIAGEERGH